MEFWAAVAVIRRRWYIVLGCAVIFGALVVVVYGQVKPSYQATGSLILTPSSKSTGSDVNPFQTTGNFASVVAEAATDEAFTNELTDRGASSIFTVAPSIANDSLLLLSTTAKTDPAALHSYRELVGLLNDRIRQLQEAQNAPPSTFYAAREITRPVQATILVGTRIKALIVLGVVGAIVTLALVFGFDSWAAARRRKRDAKLQRARMSQTSSLFQRQLTKAVERELGPATTDDEGDEGNRSSEASGS